MEYKSTSTGLLQPSDVKDGDKVILIEDAYSVEKNDRIFWNCKVKLPNGTTKLASLMDQSCGRFVDKWGKNTEDWTGHTVIVTLKESKAGNLYIMLMPSDDAINDVPAPIEPDSMQVSINADEIPF